MVTANRPAGSWLTASAADITGEVERPIANSHLPPLMKTAPGITVIRNGQLVDGTGGPPVPDAAVLIEDGRIRYAGPAMGLARAGLDGRIDNPSYDLEIDA